jgi:hypothetical protein
MSFLSIFYPYGIILQALAIVHFIRRRPDGWWMWLIIFGGGLGALVYLVAEAVPDLGLLRDSFRVFPRRHRIHELEATVRLNPAPANFEELGDLYFQEKRFTAARECFDRAISARTDGLDPFYRRALCAIEMGDHAAAVSDLEKVVRGEAGYDFHRAAGLLAYAYANAGQQDRAARLFEEVTKVSSLTETQFNYASFLAANERHAAAREWAQRILAKRATMPRFLRRRERPWFRRTSALLGRLQKA